MDYDPKEEDAQSHRDKVTTARNRASSIAGLLSWSSVFLVCISSFLSAPAFAAKPILDPIGNKTVDELALLTFTATATDTDVADTLTFSLSGTVPEGAAITADGVFTWTPSRHRVGKATPLM